MNLTVYVGFDSRNDGQQLAFEICKKSIFLNSKHVDKLTVKPLVKKDLESAGYFNRSEDNLAATEFTYTRFLSPFLNNYEGVCVFCDSDFLWQCDIYEELMPYIDEMLEQNRAVYCVQHDHVPPTDFKMDGRVQTTYPRKNWSSMIIFNCSHPNVKNLTLEAVNNQTPAWLHRFQWCDDENIGNLPHTFNYLVGFYDDEADPKVIHYTDGGPWHYLYRETEFANNWLKYLDTDQKQRLNVELERQRIDLGVEL